MGHDCRQKVRKMCKEEDKWNADTNLAYENDESQHELILSEQIAPILGIWDNKELGDKLVKLREMMQKARKEIGNKRAYPSKTDRRKAKREYWG